MEEKKTINSSDYTEVKAIRHVETGRIFRNLDEYNVFLDRYLTNRDKIRQEAELKADFLKTINIPRLTAISIEDFFDKASKIKISSDYTNGVISSNYEIIKSLFKEDVGIASDAYPINCTKLPNGRPKDDKFPGWLINYRFKYDITRRKQMRNTWLIYDPTLGKECKIPGLNTIQAVPSGSTEYIAYSSYIYLDDLPLIKARLYPKVQEYEDLIKDKNNSLVIDKERGIEKGIYVSNYPESKEVRNKIDETTLFIKKHTEILTNLKSSLISFNMEANEKYDKENPYDYKRTEMMLQKIKEKQKELENLK